MSQLAEARKLFDQLKVADSKNDLRACKTFLSSLKLALLGFSAASQQAKEELQLSREVLEFAVLLSVKNADQVGFERNYNQLKVYYADSRSAVPQSKDELLLAGLNLLRLLVQNHIAEFHTELELLPQEAQQGPYVGHVVQLEQWLMEGAYNKVLAARQHLPAPCYAAFMDLLATTVRDEVAGCSEQAYPSITVAHARQLLLFDSDAATLQYTSERGWELRDGLIYFHPVLEKVVRDIKSVESIGNSLTYARELERII